MRDLLTTLVERSLGQAAAVQPRLPSLFEPLTESAGQTHEEFSKTDNEHVAQGHAGWRPRDVFANQELQPEERPVTAALNADECSNRDELHNGMRRRR